MELSNIMRLGIDAANSGDVDAAMMYVDYLSSEKSWTPNANYVATAIWDATELAKQRTKFIEFDGIAQRNSDVARENRELRAKYCR